MKLTKRCPECGRILLYIGMERYHCTNPLCRFDVNNGGKVTYKPVEFESLFAPEYPLREEELTPDE